MKKILFYVFCAVLFILPIKTYARANVNYWYIKNYESQITVNKDSSLDIVENISADCGSAQKHGIFRVLPTFQQISDADKIQSPVSLISITDFDGRKINYSQSSNRADGTVTWKIGDANTFVTGVNYYRIKYHIKNAARHNSANFDEFYWNLSGNFWDIPIDQFKATITFPDGINNLNSSLNFYSGAFGKKDTLKYSGGFTQDNKVEISVNQTMDVGKGITASLTFPKDIIHPYVPTAWEKYGKYLFALIPLLIFLLCFRLWKKYGRDPKINPTIAPEFEIPENLSPLDMGVIMSDGILDDNYVSAGIINLAVHKVITIEEIKGSGLLAKKDYLLKKIHKNEETISTSEKSLLEKLFGGDESVKISSLKNKFYLEQDKLEDEICAKFEKIGILVTDSMANKVFFIIGAVVLFAISIWGYFRNTYFAVSLLISSLIVFVFSFLMTRRSVDGAKLVKRIQGFELYMNTAEKYRQKFNEKENIFEKFLPYAIMFGMTKEWIKKMRDIYGEEYFNSYHPVWFIGPSFAAFNVDSLASEISSMSSNMSSTISSSPSSSGSGGGGFSGGGGGGGGGGGW